ncbi:MAG: oligosaccharide flippase family protein [Synergistaceae bacterium]
MSGALYVGSNVLCSVISFMFIPILTRIMSQNDYGIVSTYTSAVSLLYVVVGISLDSTMILAYKDFKEESDDYISSILYLSLIWFILFFLVSVIFCSFIKIKLPQSLVFFALFHAFGRYLQSLFLQKLIFLRNAFVYFITNVGITFLSVSLSTTMCYMADTNKYLFKIWGESSVYIVFSISILFILIKQWNFVYNKKFWKKALSFSLPHVFHSASLYILNQSDRLMISAIIGFEQTAIYGVIFSFGMIPQMFASAFSNVYAPYCVDKMNSQKYSDIKRVTFFSILGFSILTAEILLLSPEFIRLFTPQSYWIGIPMLIPILLSAFCEFIYLVFVLQEKYYNKVAMLSIATIVSAIVNISLNMLFIPYFGAIGAAYTTLIAKIICTFMHFCVAKRLNSKTFSAQQIMYVVFFIIFISIVSHLLLDRVLLRWVIGVLVGFFSLFLCIKK